MRRIYGAVGFQGHLLENCASVSRECHGDCLTVLVQILDFDAKLADEVCTARVTTSVSGQVHCTLPQRVVHGGKGPSCTLLFLNPKTKL